MKDVLTVRKSVKLLTKIVAYGAMALWIALLTAILSTPTKAQSISTNPIVEYVDQDSYRVLTDHGGYYHVNEAGVPNGWFKQVSVAGDVTMVARGQMINGKKVGKIVYRANNEIVLIRVYNIDGILTKSTKVLVSNGAK